MVGLPCVFSWQGVLSRPGVLSGRRIRSMLRFLSVLSWQDVRGGGRVLGLPGVFGPRGDVDRRERHR
jgi:hypothetical protein